MIETIVLILVFGRVNNKDKCWVQRSSRKSDDR